MKICFYLVLMLSIVAAPAFAAVIVNSPANGATVGSSAQFVASGNTSTCSQGVASMGIYINNQLKYLVNGASLNTPLSLSPGNYNAVVQEWDYCGGATSTSLNIAVSTQSGVFMSAPTNNSTVGSPANFVASATSSCPSGVAAMGVYVNNQLAYVANGSQLNTQLSLGSGVQHAGVQEWDYCGGTSYAPVSVNVQQTGTTLYNLQAVGGWNQWGEMAPSYGICTSCWGAVTWWMGQHVSSPSLSGNATQFTIGGSTPYSDALWSNPVIGQNSTQNLPDNGHTLLPTIHNLTYDAYVYPTNLAVTQDLEFDVNMYMNGAGMEWGTQCNHLADGDWDIWDNVNAKWDSTGAPCNLVNYAWNHVTIKAQREDNNDLVYQSITVNGVTYNINRTFAPFPVSSGWWGVTVNYQMDGNFQQAANTTYVDNFSLTYW